MAMTKNQYHRSCIEQVLVILGLKPTHEADDIDAFRRKIDDLPNEIPLQAGVADFWLDLSPKQGSMRRKTSPPHSPFFPAKRQLIAPKDAIARWDTEWRLLEVRGAIRGAKTKLGQLEDLLAKEQPWAMLFDSESNKHWVMGHACYLPRYVNEQWPRLNSATGNNHLSLRHLKVVNAVALNWIDPIDHAMWCELSRQGSELVERNRSDLAASVNIG